jgi:predicted lipoprotein with Yx(FWY)xxD motif
VHIRKPAGIVMSAFVLAFGATAALAAPAIAPPMVKTATISGLGKVLVNGSGLTLYRFTSDKRGSSSCTGGCAAIWPPVIATGKAKPVAGKGAIASKLGTIKRSNGQTQVTYGGYPLYRFAADTKAGQAKGEGIEGTWFAVASSGTLVKAEAASATPAPTPAPAPAPAPAGGGYNY